MKRAHRAVHVMLWCVIAPAIVIVLWLALSQRSAEPHNPTLPEAIATEAAE